MRTVAFSLIALVLAGCGMTATTKLDITPTNNVSFYFLDERSPDQRLTKKSRVSYGETTSLGDDGISPEPPLLFKTWLEKALSKPLAGKAVVLREFSIQVVDPDVCIDEQRFSNAASSVPGAGLVSKLLARVLVGGIESARSDKTVGVRIEGKVGDRDFSARWGASFKGRVTEADVNSVIVQALDALVKEIEQIVTIQ